MYFTAPSPALDHLQALRAIFRGSGIIVIVEGQRIPLRRSALVSRPAPRAAAPHQRSASKMGARSSGPCSPNGRGTLDNGRVWLLSLFQRLPRQGQINCPVYGSAANLAINSVQHGRARHYGLPANYGALPSRPMIEAAVRTELEAVDDQAEVVWISGQVFAHTLFPIVTHRRYTHSLHRVTVAGLHRTFIGSVERGERNLSILNLRIMARALRVAASELLVE